MAALVSSLISVQDPRFMGLSGQGCLSKQSEQSLVMYHPRSLSLKPIRQRRVGGAPTHKTSVSVRAGFGESGRPSSGQVFIGGFVLGGLVMGALAYAFAPQISKAVTETDKKDLMRKLPKFLYDEEKALEKTRKILAQKIEQLNSAIDDVSSQLRTDDVPNGAVVASDEVEATA